MTVDFKKLDLNLLSVFDTVYRCASITRAAKALGMTQPSVSNALNRLRDHFGDPLFVREGRGIVPTAFARQLAVPVRDALDTLQNGVDALAAFDPGADSRRFVLSVPDVVAATALGPLIQKIADAAPHIQIELIEQNWRDPWDVLLSGRADISVDIFRHQREDITLVPIKGVDHVIIARTGHPLIEGDLDTEKFSQAAHVILPDYAEARLPVREAMLNAGLSRREMCIAANSMELAALVSQSDLIGVMPKPWVELYGKPLGLQMFPLPFPCRPSQLFLGWRADDNADPGLSWLKEMLLQRY